MKNFTKILFASLLSLLSIYAAAQQQSDTIEIQRNSKGEISFARFKPDANRKMQNAVGFLKTVLHAGQNDEFRLIKKTGDKSGFTHLKYQQYYRGIKVEDAQYLVHGKNGIIETMNGHFYQVSIPSVTPSLTEKQALGKALNYVNAKKYKWQDTAMERYIKQRTNNPQATYYPKGELVITRDYLQGGQNLRLAWKFTISSLIPNNEQWIYVDAFTGKIIRKTPLILDANIACTAQTMYSGTLGITGDSFTGGYRLKESRNGVSVETLNLHNTYNYANATDFTNTNTSWTTGSWTDIAQDQQALDAHWGAEMVLDYWRTVQSRNSLDGNGIRILSYVHAGSGWNNASWVGGTNNHFVQYGDGDGTIFRPLTALDVCAHEMGHGIDEFTANLTPGNQESGALNEGFSDIWGACVEHWAAPTKQTWLIGEDIMATTAFTCLRDLQNPNSTTAAEGPHPDTYHGNFWDYNGEPHNNSTVLSHWFYLLSQGGSGTNDLGNSYLVNGIDINAAQLIAFKCETMLTSGATYNDARNMTIEAARQIYGTNACEVIAVTNAWYAVGVGSAYVLPQAQFTYSQNSCSSGSITISIADAASYSWNVTGDLLIDGTSTTKTTTVNYINVTGTNGNVQVTYSLPCAGSLTAYGAYEPFVRTIQYAPPGPPLFPGDQLSVSIDPVEFANNYKWYLNDQLVAQGEPQYCTCDYPENPVQCGMNTIRVDVVTDCGTFTSAEDEFEMECYYAAKNFSISPNPAQKMITITVSNPQNTKFKSLSSSKTGSKNITGIKTVKIYDASGKLMKQQLFSNNLSQVQINISGLSAGVYFVKVSDGKEEGTQRLVIGK